MEAKQFRLWQAELGLSGREVADAMGKTPDTITNYRTKGVPEREVTIVRLAMAAIAAKLPPWGVK